MASKVKEEDKKLYPKVDYSYQKSISYSQLQMYRQCPHKWDLNYPQKKGMFDYNFQSDDKTPYFLKYGYVWHFTGFPIEQREDMMRQTWEATKGLYED